MSTKVSCQCLLSPLLPVRHLPPPAAPSDRSESPTDRRPHPRPLSATSPHPPASPLQLSSQLHASWRFQESPPPQQIPRPPSPPPTASPLAHLPPYYPPHHRTPAL